MLYRIFRIVFTILGALAGYGVAVLLKLWLIRDKIDVDAEMTMNQQILFAIIFILLFAIFFFRLAPVITRQSHFISDSIGRELQSVSGTDVLVVVIGLIFGLVIAFFVGQIYSGISNRVIYTIALVSTYVLFAYLGVVIANKKGKDIVSLIAERRTAQPKAQEKTDAASRHIHNFSGSKHKKNAGCPKILDTSVIIDGRIYDVLKTGFMDGSVVIPDCVLTELRHIADSSDSMRRTRGRRGLDILNHIQEEYGIEIYNTDSTKALKDIPEVDIKLLKLAEILGGKIVTNDYNLNKVATINGVEVLNLNELANALKPIAIPGDVMTVTPVKQGKDCKQAIAYLDDGTMVVLEDGRSMIGKTTEIHVTSVMQTAAGRMIFGRVGS